MQVLVRDNNVDQALKALKKKMQREGIFREMKLRGHYEKPSEKKAREKAEAVRRARKLARKKLQREGLLPMKPKPVFGAGPGGDQWSALIVAVGPAQVLQRPRLALRGFQFGKHGPGPRFCFGVFVSGVAVEPRAVSVLIGSESEASDSCFDTFLRDPVSTSLETL